MATWRRGVRHSTVGQSCYVPLGQHLVLVCFKHWIVIFIQLFIQLTVFSSYPILVHDFILVSILTNGCLFISVLVLTEDNNTASSGLDNCEEQLVTRQ